ncbi:MAG: hypothetical protein WCO44_00700 [Bacteroidota bacterium]
MKSKIRETTHLGECLVLNRGVILQQVATSAGVIALQDVKKLSRNNLWLKSIGNQVICLFCRC